MIKDPIFIVGAPRSGTSLLGRILEKHSSLVHVREPRIIWKYGNDAKSDLLTIDDARPEVIEYIRRKFAKVAPASKGLRLLEKSPNNSLRIPFILKIFPDAKFVHIMRDGYESSLSISKFWQNRTSDLNYDRVEHKESILSQRIKEAHWRQIPYYSLELAGRLFSKLGLPSNVLWGPRLPGLSAISKELSTLEIGALQWRFCVEYACYDGRKLGDGVYKELRLEQINESSLEDICSFLGLELEEKLLQYFQENFVQHETSKRKLEANDEQIKVIEKIIQPTMQWLYT